MPIDRDDSIRLADSTLVGNVDSFIALDIFC